MYSLTRLLITHHIEDFLNFPACHHCPYSCQAKMKFEKFKWEIHYVIKVFCATYKKIPNCYRPY